MINLDEDKVLGLVPARGGSKSIPLKNMLRLAGRPLVAYCIAAAQTAMPEVVNRLVCSTDHEAIADFCRRLGAEVIARPAEYATDAAPTEDAVRHVLRVLAEQDGAAPGIVVLLQPTSPFVLREHINGLVDMLRQDPALDTALTISLVPHYFHALNQRSFENGRVRFIYEAQRRLAYNKQLKPKNYRFGNLVAFRATSVLAGNTCFGPNSGGLEIDRYYAHDVDGPDDVLYAEFLIREGLVRLPPTLPPRTP